MWAIPYFKKLLVKARVDAEGVAQERHTAAQVHEIKQTIADETLPFNDFISQACSRLSSMSADIVTGGPGVRDVVRDVWAEVFRRQRKEEEALSHRLVARLSDDANWPSDENA